MDILAGFGGTLDPRNLAAPGFVVKTGRIWEDLISLALRLGFPTEDVSVQPMYRLGSRYSRETPNTVAELSVVPDYLVSVQANGGKRKVVVDAKYKGRVDQGPPTVSNADIYESLAFSKAVGSVM